MTTLIFCSDILYDELINAEYFLCSALLLFSRKLPITVTGADRHKMAEISASSNTQEIRSCKAQKEARVFQIGVFV